jgi:hypothetical protein
MNSTPRSCLAAVLAAQILAQPALAQRQCLQPVERAAVAVKALQVDLLVAMISCRNVPGANFASQYNNWLSRNQARLDSNFRALREYFRRAHGGQGNARYDSFATGAMNEASRQSNTNPGFCRDSVQLYQWAMATEPAQLESAALAFAQSRGVQTDSCQPEVRRAR